jgi:tyrosine-protein phosphatase SIW14
MYQRFTMQHYSSLRRRAAIFGLTASLTLASAWAHSQNDNLPNFQKVDDHVYRGAQPTDSGFKDLAQLGIKTIVDLRDIGEHSQANEEKIVTGLGMRYVSIPMHGLSTPKGDKVAAVQALFNDTTSGPVFVHCKRGADRTGMVVAVYRISHDQWDNKRALTEAKSYGMSFFERAIQSYVMNYRPSVALATAGADSASPIADTRGVR